MVPNIQKYDYSVEPARSKYLSIVRTSCTYICSHTFCYFLCLSLLVVISMCFLLYVLKMDWSIFVVIRMAYGKVCTADHGRGKRHLIDSSCAAELLARQTELSWPDVRKTSVSNFSRAKKPQSKFCSPFSLSFFIFPLSFRRRVTRLAPSYWTILVKQDR